MAIEIKEFRKFEKNTLRGFLTVLLHPSGIEIRDITLHEKNNTRWVNMPSRPYQDEDGSTKYSYIIYFPNKDRAKQFQNAVLTALDKFQPQGNAPDDPPF